MIIPRPSPKNHEDNALQHVIKYEEKKIEREKQTDNKPQLNEFLLTSPKNRQMYDTEVKKEEFISLDNREVPIDDHI